MKTKALLFTLFLSTLGFSQTSKFRNSMEFAIMGGSAVKMDFAAEGHITHRLNERTKLWNSEVVGGLGFWGNNNSFGVHGIAFFRLLFGRKRHQVYGDFGGAYLLNFNDSYNGELQPVVNLGYRFTPKTDGWHVQISSGTWGFVSLGAGLKW